MTVYWCAGMYTSGSTWAYNVMRGIAAVLEPMREVRGRFVNGVADLDGLEDPEPVHVVKSTTCRRMRRRGWCGWRRASW